MGNGFCLGIPLAGVNLGELGEIGVNWRLPQKIAAIRGSSGNSGYFWGAGVVVKCASQKIAAIRGSSGNSGYFGGAGVVVKCA